MKHRKENGDELLSCAGGCTLAQVFWRRAAEQPDQIALRQIRAGEVESFSWSMIAKLVARWIHELRSQSIGSTTCASYLPNSIDWIALDLACQTTGWTHVAIDRKLTLVQAKQMADFCSCSMLISNLHRQSAFSNAQFSLEDCREQAAKIDPESTALALFTSGSTGLPKAVMHSHRGLLANALAKLGAAPQFSDDVRANVLPFSHAYARTCELSTWLIAGGELLLYETFEELAADAGSKRPTLINLVPYLAEKLAGMLAADPLVFGDRLRLLQVGGAALSEPLWETLASSGLPPLQGYGLTEAGPVVCSNRAGSQRPGVVGPPVEGVSLRIDSGGQLWVSGPSVMQGYMNAEAETQTIIQDGWLATGDLAEETAAGIRITGRVKQQLTLSTGQQVSPEPVEERIGRLEGVSRVFVFGQDQPFVAAIIWLTAEEHANDLRIDSLKHRIAEICQDLPRFSIPEKFILLAEENPNPANGLANHKGQLLRDEILSRYRDQIDRMLAR